MQVPKLVGHCYLKAESNNNFVIKIIRDDGK